jgi:hypothetical protein
MYFSIDCRIYSNLRSLVELLESAEATEDFELPSVENVTTEDLEILPTNSKVSNLKATSNFIV